MSRKSIKIAATSDLHGFLDELENDVNRIKPDILVIAGDINPCRIDINSDDWFRNKFFPLVTKLDCEVVAIPGNHDFWLCKFISTCKNIATGDGLFPFNFHLLCDSQEIVEGLTFYGTPWVPWINGKWCWEASDNSLAYAFSKIPENIDVLISHTPPKINHQFIDISTENDERFWRHFGSQELKNAIVNKSPSYVFCGHIHSGDHKEHRIENSKGNESICYNVSRVNEKYFVNYPLTLTTIGVGK